MKYNCANEFDLNEIYKKLTSGHCTAKVPANAFFSDQNELELLQKSMNKIMYLKKQARRYAK